MLDKNTVELLRKDLPKESVQKREYKNSETGAVTMTLTGYKPQYYTERMNDAFGHDGWDFEILKYDNDGKFAWVLGRLSIYSVQYKDKDSLDGPVIRKLISIKEQFGTSRITKLTGMGDAYKGAATNSMEKSASFYDVGHKAYKGLEALPGKRTEDLSDRDKIKEELIKLCKEHKIGKIAFATLKETVLKSKKETEELTEEELTKILEYVKTNKAPF